MIGLWRSAMPVMHLLMLLAMAGSYRAVELSFEEQVLKSERKFTIENNRFVKDGKPLQIISGRLASSSLIRFVTTCRLRHVSFPCILLFVGEPKHV